MKHFLRLIFVLSLLSFASVRATELTDLGSGLAYLRVHSLADSEAVLHQAVPGPGALVLDLRYATAGPGPSEALNAALARRSGPAPLFILVSPATPPAAAQALARPGRSSFILGIAGSSPAPQVVVKTDAASDRRAYVAFDTGTPLAGLISGKIAKERFDEATLVHEFNHGNPPPLPGDRPGPTPAGQSLDKLGTLSPSNGQPGTVSPPPPSDPTAPKAPAGEAAAAPPVDRVLQRAVHLHQAMLVLSR